LKRLVIYSLSLVCLTVVTSLLGYHFIRQQLTAPLKLEAPQLITLNKGDTAHQVLAGLHEQNNIDTYGYWSAKLWLRVAPELARFKAGSYELTADLGLLDAMILLHSGKEKQFSVTLVEGQNLKQWLQQLGQTSHLSYIEADLARLTQVLKPQGDKLEGWLMPDTYFYTSGTAIEVLIQQAYTAMHSYLTQAWHTRAQNLPYRSPYEALIMASIIEKETGLASERARIAGVFVNRLNKKMRLQTDPTVIYGMGDKFDGNIRRRDLRQATPYNTYVIKGLPPTPIAMPGREAIDAALHPLDTNEYYFVARGDGSHQFSSTLQQHNAAVRKYQLKK